MPSINQHLISTNSTIQNALTQLDLLAQDAILFVVQGNLKLIGSLTDGDIRRGLINGCSVKDSITKIMNPNPKFVKQNEFSIERIKKYREFNFRIVPLVDSNGNILKLINFRNQKSYLPVDAVFMVGGRGQRLSPLTNSCPKPLLPIHDKPILEHNIDRMIQFGIDTYFLSVNYLSEMISNHFGDGSTKDVTIQYIKETFPLGTLGSISLVNEFKHKDVIVMNGDLLTNIDFEDFYNAYLTSKADIMLATIPYEVKIPYAVVSIENEQVKNLSEKPTLTYYANGGIYLIKSNLLNTISKNSFLDATTFIEEAISNGKIVKNYPIVGFWKDIGNKEDYYLANESFKKIVF